MARSHWLLYLLHRYRLCAMDAKEPRAPRKLKSFDFLLGAKLSANLSDKT